MLKHWPDWSGFSKSGKPDDGRPMSVGQPHKPKLVASDSRSFAGVADPSTGLADSSARVPDSSRGARVAIGVALIAGVAFVAALALGLRPPGGGIEPGVPAPTFVLESYDGPTIPLESLRGDVVVLNFWASWCIECDLEAADLEAVWNEYKGRGVTVIGVAYTDTEAAARAYIKRHGISYPNGPDGGARISRAYGLTGVPETVLIDPDGLIVPLHGSGATELAKVVGPILVGAPFTPSDLRATLDDLLSSEPGG